MARFKKKNRREFVLTQKALEAYFKIENEAKLKGFKRVKKAQDNFRWNYSDLLNEWANKLNSSSDSDIDPMEL